MSFFAAVNAGNSATATTLAVTLPAGIQNGDVLLLVTGANTGTATATVAGMTAVSGPDYTAASVLGSYVFKESLTAAASGTTRTVTWNTASRISISAVILRGQDYATITVASNIVIGASVAVPTVTSQSGDTVVLVVGRNTGTTAPVVTIPAPYATETGAAGLTNYASGADISTAIGVDVGTAGVTATTSPAASHMVGYAITLAPVSSGSAFSGSLSLSGLGSLSLFSGIAVSGPLSRTGSGTVALSGAPAVSGALSRTGAGTVALSGAPAASGSLARSGAGTLALSGTTATTGSLALTGSGSLALSGSGAGQGSGSLGLSGSGTIGLAGKPTFTGSLARTGSGSLTNSGSASLSGTRALSGSGSLAGLGYPGVHDDVALTGSGTLALDGSLNAADLLPLSSDGALDLVGVADHTGSLDLAGDGVLAFNIVRRNITVSVILDERHEPSVPERLTPSAGLARRHTATITSRLAPAIGTRRRTVTAKEQT